MGKLEINLDSEVEFQIASDSFAKSRNLEEFVDKFYSELKELKNSPKLSPIIEKTNRLLFLSILFWLLSLIFLLPYLTELARNNMIISTCEEPIRPSVEGGLSGYVTHTDALQFDELSKKFVEYNECESQFRKTVEPTVFSFWRPLYKASGIFIGIALPFLIYDLGLIFLFSLRNTGRRLIRVVSFSFGTFAFLFFTNSEEFNEYDWKNILVFWGLLIGGYYWWRSISKSLPGKKKGLD